MTDAFDNLMINTCSILAKGQSGSVDDSGHEVQTLTSVLDDVPCRLSTLGGGGREDAKQARYGINRFKVYMRPPVIPSPTGPDLTIHHWIQISGKQYNVLNVDDPSNLHHHLEVLVSLVTP